MILDSTTRSIELVLAGTVTTTQLKVTSSWVDMTATATTPGATTASSNNTTAVTIVAAPAASTQRKVNSISIFNADTASATVTVRYNDNATIYPIVVVIVPTGNTLFWTDVTGWKLLDANGNTGIAGPPGPAGATGPAGSTGLSGVNAQTGTAYTLVLSDANKLITVSNASAITLTVPPNSSVALPVGTPIYVEQYNTGQITVAAGAGVTINNASTLKTRAQYSVCGLVKTATDTWEFYGDMA